MSDNLHRLFTIVPEPGPAITPPYPPPHDDNPDRAAFAIAYGLMSVSGFLMGLLAGWLVWG